jgi:hypothetical protein
VPAEDIPRIITEDANEGWRIPRERSSFPINEADTWRSIMVDRNIPIEGIKESTKVTVTSEIARKLQGPITILDRPFDVRGTYEQVSKGHLQTHEQQRQIHCDQSNG